MRKVSNDTHEFIYAAGLVLMLVMFIPVVVMHRIWETICKTFKGLFFYEKGK